MRSSPLPLRKGWLAALSPAALAACFALSGCAASLSARSAQQGDYAEARRAMAEQIARGAFDADDATEVALAVARGEVSRAKGASGAAHIRALAACPRPLDDALADKADDDDEAGAAAAALRIESRLAEIREIREVAERGRAAKRAEMPPGARDAWRATGARALVEAENGAERRALFLDGDQEVRLGALRASLDARDPGDVEATLEAARLDPYPLANTIAIRAAGAQGGERVVLALKDLWALSDEPTRQAIVDAWSQTAAVDTGGSRELRWATSSAEGAPAIAAAYALSRRAGEAPEAVDLLVRSIESGLARDRVFAIAVAPASSPAVRAALLKAKVDPEASVAFAALVRLFEAKPQRDEKPAAEQAKLREELLAIAKGGAAEALQARRVLAEAGAREVLPMLTRDAKAKAAAARRAAGADLIALGERAQAGPLLLDDEVSVRLAVSCAMLQKP